MLLYKNNIKCNGAFLRKRKDMKLSCKFTTQAVFVHEREGERERCTILI